MFNSGREKWAVNITWDILKGQSKLKSIYVQSKETKFTLAPALGPKGGEKNDPTQDHRPKSHADNSTDRQTRQREGQLLL